MSLTWDEVLAAQQGSDQAAGYEVGRLAREWVVPPFSILDTNSGQWRDRRRAWLALGIESELGRGEAGQRSGALNRVVSMLPYAPGGWKDHPSYQSVGATDTSSGIRASTGFADGRHPAHRREADSRSNLTGAAALPDYADFGTALVAPGTSIFDPVLCELSYRWWCPPGGSVLDPFAGGSVRGIVAAMLGHAYTGIDLSAAQVEANREQAARIVPADRPMPRWYTGDSREVVPDLPAGEQFDMVFTCPPYYDLEVYSDHPADLSNMATYAEFVEAYQEIIAAACRRLRSDRLAVVVVSDVRDKHGFYLGLRRDTELAFERASYHLYNDGTLTADPDPATAQDVVRKWDEAKLVNAVGTLAMRTMNQMRASRKLGRMHQDILVFARTALTTHGWDHARVAPPQPQTDLGLVSEPPAPEQVPLLPDPVAELETVEIWGIPDDPPPMTGEQQPGTVDLPKPEPVTLVVTPSLWQPAIQVVLSAVERAWAAKIANDRLDGALAEGRPDTIGLNGLDTHVLGAEAELAVAKALDVPWPAYVGTYHAKPDLEPDLEVRCSRTTGRVLRMRQRDVADPVKSRRRYVAVVPTSAGYHLLGWLHGYEAADVPMTDPGGYGAPCALVPESHLRPLSTLQRPDGRHYRPPTKGQV